jgi:hypothetical protein
MDGVPYRKDEVIDGKLWITTYATGAETRIIHETNELNSVAGFRNHPMRCAFDVWKCGSGGVEWCGVWNDTSYNKKTFYSWFKAYDYTPEAGDNGTDFTLVDYDDFDGDWEKSRWDVGYDMLYSNGKGVEVMVGTGKEISVELYGKYDGVIPEDSGDTAASKPSNFPNYSAVNEQGPRKFSSPSILDEKAGLLRYHVSIPGNVRLALYLPSGRLARVLINSRQQPGDYSFSINGISMAQGTYILCLETQETRQVRRMVSVSPR